MFFFLFGKQSGNAVDAGHTDIHQYTHGQCIAACVNADVHISVYHFDQIGKGQRKCRHDNQVFTEKCAAFYFHNCGQFSKMNGFHDNVLPVTVKNTVSSVGSQE